MIMECSIWIIVGNVTWIICQLIVIVIFIIIIIIFIIIMVLIIIIVINSTLTVSWCWGSQNVIIPKR